ncbi:MAG: carboxypeptidase regulatory-like domain-containing protein [Verrucomicrobiota bacterium]
MRLLSVILLLATPAVRAESLTGVVRCQTQAVANAIVYLGVSTGTQTSSPPVVLRQTRGEWTPRVQLARSGGVLVLKNDDPTLHVVHLDLYSGTNLPRRLLTEAMPYAGYEKSFQLESFREPVLLKVSAGNGETAVGYVAVLPHAAAALTGADGRFAISAVTAGTYKVFVWNETYGTLTRDVKVIPGRATNLEIEFTSAAPKLAD